MNRFSLSLLVIFLPLLIAFGHFSLTFERQRTFTAMVAVARSDATQIPVKLEQREFDGAFVGWPLVFKIKPVHNDYNTSDTKWYHFSGNILIASSFSAMLTLVISGLLRRRVALN